MRVCLKSNCPHRLMVGREEDADVAQSICMTCNRFYYSSPSAGNRVARMVRWVAIIVVGVWVVGGAYLIAVTQDLFTMDQLIEKTEEQLKSDTPENTLKGFFEDLNRKDYRSAYERTDHKGWGSYSEFKENTYWSNHTDYKVEYLMRKNYQSSYGGTYVLFASYSMKDTIGNVLNQRYDFHLKESDPSEWRIVRMIKER